MKKILMATAMLTSIGFTNGALAQTRIDDRQEAQAIDDVVVTARRREESAQSVPVSVVAVSAQQLENANVRSLNDLTSIAPGLRFTSEGGASSTNVTLRGLGKLALGEGVPSVVTYFAEAPITGDGLNVPTLDLTSVQVLKGPQGTLFGRNTIGGAVLLTPTAPDYTSSGYISASLGDYNYRALEGAANIPLVQDRLALRVAGQYRVRDGLTKNYNGGPDFEDLDQYNLRASLLFEPTANLSNTLILEFFKAEEQPSANILLSTNPNAFGPDFAFLYGAQIAAYGALQQQIGPHTAFAATDDYAQDRQSFGLFNTTQWDLSDSIRLKNIFSYRVNEVFTTINTGGVGPMNSPFAGDLVLFNASTTTDREYLTNELQLQGDSFDGRLDWIVGAFYGTDKSHGPMGANFRVLDFLADGPTNAFNTAHTENTSTAVFSQVGVDLSSLTEGLRANIGYRHSWDEVEGCGGLNSTRYLSSSECQDVAGRNLADGFGIIKNEGDAGTYTLGLDWRVSPDLFFYGVHRKGYRAAGINTPAFETPFTTGGVGCAIGGFLPVPCPDLRAVQTTEEETVRDVEVGVKTDFTFGDVRTRLNLSAFYTEYQNALLFVEVANTLGIPTTAPDTPARGSVAVNAADIIIKGLEMDASISPVPGLTLSVNGAYTTQEVDKVTAPSIAGVTTLDGSINLPTPKFSGTASVRWDADWRPLDGDLSFSADYYHTDRFQAQAGVYLPGYDVLSARIDLRNIGGTGVDVGVWVKNALDEDYAVAPSVLVPGFIVNTVNFGEPRTIGLDLRYRWGN